MTPPAPPIGLLAELTHRCPLRCGYCSNPLALAARSDELATAAWCDVFAEAAALGVLQLHLSGGEPTARADLETLVGAAAAAGLYSNLITSGVLLDRTRLLALDRAGLDHVQLSVQDTRPETADAIAGHAGGHEKKRMLAGWVRELDLPLTLNAVVHRRNIERVPALVEMAVEWGAARVEIANVQYHGWAARNVAALLPSLEQLEAAERAVEAARVRLRGVLEIDFVTPDYYGRRPKPCMQGWGRRFINVSPAGFVLPCHAAESIPGLRFDRVGDRPLADIWRDSEAFERFRGFDWMREPCRSCDHREQDFGGCRCQAMALAGDASAADPVCGFSPDRPRVDALIESARAGVAPYRYRGDASPA